MPRGSAGDLAHNQSQGTTGASWRKTGRSECKSQFPPLLLAGSARGRVCDSVDELTRLAQGGGKHTFTFSLLFHLVSSLLFSFFFSLLVLSLLLSCVSSSLFSLHSRLVLSCLLFSSLLLSLLCRLLFSVSVSVSLYLRVVLWSCCCVVLCLVVWCVCGVLCGVVCVVWHRENPVCPLKTCPCVRSKRPRVYRHHAHMSCLVSVSLSLSLSSFSVSGRFECAHGHVLNGHTAGSGRVIVSSAYQNLPT